MKNIIVIGASAGGFEAVSKLLSKIPSDLPVAIFIVVHLSKDSSTTVLIKYLKNHTSYKCRVPDDEEKIIAGTVYLAPPDLHLFIKSDTIRLLNETPENRWRPSIDVLFRSAAAAYGSSVIGIVLSGMMDDGTSGMSVIKHYGGTCLVQEPSEAEFPEMPLSVLNHVKVDHQVHIADMGHILYDIISKTAKSH